MNKKSIGNEYLKIFIPISLTMITIFLYNIIDSYFISKLGEDALSGFGLISPLHGFVIILLSTLATGVSINISKAFGSQFKDRVKQKILIGSSIAIPLSLFIFLIFLFFKDNITNLFDVTNIIKQHFLSYYKYWIFTILLDGIILIYSFSLNSTNNAILNTKINIFVLLVNTILDYFLIFGVTNLIPPLGVEGASLATLISKVVQLIILSYILNKYNLLLLFISTKKYLILLKKISRISIPLILQGTIVPIGALYFATLISTQTSFEIAAWTLFMRMEFLVFIVLAATNTTISILIGKYLGEKKYNKIPALIIISNRIIFSWTLLLLILSVTFGKQFGSIFLTNKESIDIFYFTLFLGYFAYLFGGQTSNISKTFVVLYKPYIGLSISTIRVLLSTIILPSIFNIYYGYYGLFFGFILGIVIAYVYSYFLFKKKLNYRNLISFKNII